MSNIFLSTKQDWIDYWTKQNVLTTIQEDYSYGDFIKDVVSNIGGNKSAIELGGFPGKFSLYLKKYCHMNVTLLDYVIDPNIIQNLFKINGLNSQYDLRIIEADVFSFEPTELYDLVCSFGLIEHFTDINKILEAHVKFLKPGGILLIVLPNFLGINGYLQKYFDPSNFSLHNLESMKFKFLNSVLSGLGMKDIYIGYYPSTQVWLEDIKKRGFIIRVFVRFVNELTVFLSKIIGKENILISNSILISAKRPI